MIFKHIKASDFCDKVFDGTHDSPKYCELGYPLVTSKYINNNNINISDAPLISKIDRDKIDFRSKVIKNDILISMIGTVGLIARINFEPSFSIKNIGVFRPKNELDSKYLFYYCQSSQFQNKIKEKMYGSTQQYITLDGLRNLEFDIPNAEDQQHIVDTIHFALKSR